MAPEVKAVKSAKRALEIFGFFNATRREATVMEIAREYGYPQSSTSELLNYLVELGFLDRDRHRRAYWPTAKVAVLGSWASPELFRCGRLLAAMDDLAREFDCAVILAGRVGLRVEHLETVPATVAVPAAEMAGPLTASALGKLLLAATDGRAARKLIHRINSEVDEARRVRWEDLAVQIEHIRAHGASISPGVSQGAGGVVSVLLPGGAARDRLAIGMAVAEGDLRGGAFFTRALRQAVAAGLETRAGKRDASYPQARPVALPALIRAV